MNSRVIKFVAGAGKTTESEKYLRNNPNGLYIAFTNRVVNELSSKGYLSKTIDSLFVSYIFPKFFALVPLISNNSKINSKEPPYYLKGAINIKIREDGCILNQRKKTLVSLDMSNDELHNKNQFPNSKFIKYIFSKDSLNLNHEQREQLAMYIIKNFPNQLVSIIKERFSFIIIDEAQDLKGYREEFAKLLYESDFSLILLGDDNQNIEGGGKWFESLKYDECNNKSFRCPEVICKWIRENLKIDIFGSSNKGKYNEIKYNDVLQLDDGQRVLLYNAKQGKQVTEIVEKWIGKKETIKTAKGETIKNDIVIVGNTLNKKNLYTAITRTTMNVYSTIKNK